VIELLKGPRFAWEGEAEEARTQTACQCAEKGREEIVVVTIKTGL